MIAMLLLGALSTIAILTTVYWACLVVGGGLVALSMFGGDSDTDVSVDTDVDVGFDADVDLDADGAFDVDTDGVDLSHAHTDVAALSTWFSMRFVVFFVAVFGAVGVILRHLTALGTMMTFVVALVVGLIIGQVVHHVFRAVRSTSGDSTPRPQDYVNRLARVTIAITPPDKGEVSIQVRSARRFVPAVATGEAPGFSAGDEVVVVGYRAGVAQVVSREEFERKARSA
jgi:membrane protein implicated in regulation of membrane protease activity